MAESGHANRWSGKTDEEEIQMASPSRLVASLVLFIIIASAGVGCAITTTYGVEPKQDTFDPDIYTFTVFYNAFSSEEDVAKNANKQIEEFIGRQDYVDSKIVNVSQEGGKSLYEVKFYREQQ